MLFPFPPVDKKMAALALKSDGVVLVEVNDMVLSSTVSISAVEIIRVSRPGFSIFASTMGGIAGDVLKEELDSDFFPEAPLPGDAPPGIGDSTATTVTLIVSP